MKIKILSLVLILGLGFVSCNDEGSRDKGKYEGYNASTLREAHNWHILDGTKPLYLIEFKKEVIDLPVKDQRVYHAVNLPEKYMTGGLQVKASYRKLTAKERKKLGCYVSDVIGAVVSDDFPFIYIENVE